LCWLLLRVLLLLLLVVVLVVGGGGTYLFGKMYVRLSGSSSILRVLHFAVGNAT
jgi:hypothetical protein